MDANEKKYRARRYFILSFKKYVKNEFNVLAKKYKPSIRQALNDYIDIHEEITNIRTNEKLLKSRAEISEALKFYMKNSILYKGPYAYEYPGL